MNRFITISLLLLFWAFSANLVLANAPAPEGYCLEWDEANHDCLEWGYEDEEGIARDHAIWIYGGVLGGLMILGGIGIHYIRKNHAS